MSLLGSISRKVSPKEVVNYFRRTLIGSGELGRKEINQIKGKLKNLSQEDKERLRTADLEDLTPEEVDLVMFGFVGFKDFGMPNKTIVQMKGNEFSQFKKKINKIVDDVMGGKTESVEEFTLEDGKIRSNMVEKNKEIPTGDPTQLTLFNQGGKASMLGKPDYIDIDGDGNKTEPMKTAAKQAKERDGMAEGGEMDKQMSMLMNKEQEPPMESDEEMEDNYLDFILDEALTEEEEDMLMSKLQQDEQLSMLFDKVVEVASEFAGSGPVEGPGSGVSDSIPARLSDGEFVFTAKAVEEIGADNLMAMMKDAEMKADERQGMANGGEMDEDTVVVKGDDEPARQEIRVVKETVDAAGRMVKDEDEISKNIKSNMMLDPNQQHVRS